MWKILPKGLGTFPDAGEAILRTFIFIYVWDFSSNLTFEHFLQKSASYGAPRPTDGGNMIANGLFLFDMHS